MKIIKDGDKYLVVKDGFVNLQESDDYFFIDKKELEKFLKAVMFEGLTALMQKLDIDLIEEIE